MCAIIKLAFVLCVAVTAHGFNLGPTQIVFHLFTRANPTQSQPLLPSQASILTSGFDYNRRTVITIHSYGQSVAGNFNAHLVPAYLATEDVNVLAVDWSPGASAYTQGLSNAPQVGAVVAQFVNILDNDFGYSAANIHIVGVGLGGHAAGIAARRTTGTIPHIIDASRASAYTQGLSNAPQVGAVVAQFVNILDNDFGYSAANIHIVGVGLGAHAADISARRTTGTIPHIIALDPSLHGWTHHPEKLTKEDAQLVEVIHTTAGHYGYDHPMGDIDFYPNGGSWQTGCGTNVACSHTYSYVFLAESIRADIPNANAARFIGTACDSMEEAFNLHCDGARDAVFGGIHEKTNVSGIYSFVTNISPPFARN